jgi:hypothetical protein
MNPADQRGYDAAIEASSQELPILVGGRIAKIPFPMSEDDFELLIGTLNLWKKRLLSVDTELTSAAAEQTKKAAAPPGRGK